MSLRIVLILGIVFLSMFGAFAITVSVAMAQTSSQKLLVVNAGLEGEQVREVDRSLVIVDPLTKKVVGRVPLGNALPPEVQPHDVAASADGKLAFVTNISYARNPNEISHDTISVIDLAARKELRRVQIGPHSFPHGIVFVGGKLYFTAEGYGLVGRYDPESNQVDWLQGHGQLRGHEIVINKDATKIFTANAGSNTVAAIELWQPPADFNETHAPPKLWKVTPIPVGKEPEGIAMSPDEREVWTTNRADDSLSIIDVATNKVKKTINLKAKEPYRVGFTLDGKRVLVCTRDTGEVLILDAAIQKEIKRIKNVGVRMHDVLMASDGSRAYVAFKGPEQTPTPNNVAIIDLETLEVTGYLTTGERPESLAWAVME